MKEQSTNEPLIASSCSTKDKQISFDQERNSLPEKQEESTKPRLGNINPLVSDIFFDFAIFFFHLYTNNNHRSLLIIIVIVYS